MKLFIVIIIFVFNISEIICQLELDSIVKGELRMIDYDIPSGYFMNGANVNPFGAKFGTTFGLPNESMVEISIYRYDSKNKNISERVCTVLESNLEAGNYDIIWNLVNDNGEMIEIGAYMLQVVATFVDKSKNQEIYFQSRTLLPFYLGK